MILTQRDSAMSVNRRVIPPQITKLISPNARRGRETGSYDRIIFFEGLWGFFCALSPPVSQSERAAEAVLECLCSILEAGLT